MLKINVDRLDELFSAVSRENSLYLPVSDGKCVNFGLYDKESKVCLNKLKTEKSPKDLFFAQSENFADFKTDGKNISISERRPQNEKFVLFGARACDVKSLDILDRVFLSEPQDAFYKAARQNCTVIALVCDEPDETCFCGTFGIDLTEPAGDVTAWIKGDTLYWQSSTEKGDILTAQLDRLLEQADENDKSELEDEKERIKETAAKLPFSGLKLDRLKSDTELNLFNSTEWEKLSKACLGCGSCTFVCPTCQCYDIRDYDAGAEIKRYRCWDSCMYSDFTMMAHGNPRKTQMSRFRQRFMHKLVYFPANNGGLFGCVGCGRCVQKCPVSMNIAKVIKALEED